MGIRDERLDRAAQMPHRSFAGDNRLDVRLESEIGRLSFNGLITKTEYEAGIRYANIALLYLNTTDAPSPYGNENIAQIPDDECERRKIDMCAARHVLSPYGRDILKVLDRVVVYDKPLPLNDDSELETLRIGLRALAGESSGATIIPFPVRVR